MISYDQEADSGVMNGLIGTHIATRQYVEIELTKNEMTLATTKNMFQVNIDWREMCLSVRQRTGIHIIGQIDIQSIVINGVVKTFH